MDKIWKVLIGGTIILLLLSALSVVIFIAAGMWQLGLIDGSGLNTSILEDLAPSQASHAGFLRITPQTNNHTLTSEGDLNTIFVNNAGSLILVTSVEVENPDGMAGACTTQVAPTRVGVGGNFTVSASGCAPADPGSSYTLNFRISYDVSPGGVTASKQDLGFIRGGYA